MLPTRTATHVPLILPPAAVAKLEDAGLVPTRPPPTDLEMWQASQVQSEGSGGGSGGSDGNDGNDGRAVAGSGGTALDADEYADEYDHNLDFMHRQPGWNADATKEAVETYENFMLWADYYPDENP